ncbi:MAG: hypothetical protein M1115_03300 [Actinobacteria bacterium]|nr:hypothetical protein [Actinomycetota bacterium]
MPDRPVLSSYSFGAVLSPNARDDSGLGLIEVVLAIALFAAVSFPIASAVRSGISAVSSSQQRIVAAELANSALQEAQALPYSDLSKGIYPGSCLGADPANDPLLKEVSTQSGTIWEYTSTGETVPDRAACVAETPVVPYQSTVLKNGTTYTVSTYPMQVASSPVIRVITRVSWSNPQSSSNVLADQTLVYGPDSTVSPTQPTSPGPGGNPPNGSSTCGQAQEALLANPSPAGSAYPAELLSIYYIDESAMSSVEVLVDDALDVSVSASVTPAPLPSPVEPTDDCGGSPPNADDPPSESSQGPQRAYVSLIVLDVPTALLAGETITIRVNDGDGNFDAYTWTVL